MKELYSAMSHSYFVGKKIKNVNLKEYSWLEANPTLASKTEIYPIRNDSEKQRKRD